MAVGFGGRVTAEHKTRVFLSYSRRDGDFARKLADALTECGYIADFDQSANDPANITTGISAQEEWWKRLEEMIAASEAMVLIVSPFSAESPVCGEEIAYARTLGKRVIPILLRAIDFGKAPPRLAALNVKLSFEDGALFDASLAALTKVLEIDLDWHREGARLSTVAVAWHGEGRPEARLLSAGAVSEAEVWASRRPFNASPPGEPLLSFLAASRAKAEDERKRLLRITGLAFVKPAEQALADGREDAALRLVAAGMYLSEDLDMKLVPERLGAALLAADSQALRCVMRGHKASVESAEFSPDGQLVLSASVDETVRIWDVRSGREILLFDGHEDAVRSASFSPDGGRVVTASWDGTARVWDAVSGREMLRLEGHQGDVESACFSHDGARVVTASQDCTAKVWDAASGKLLRTLAEHQAGVLDVAFAANGAWIATASSDGAVRLYDLASGRDAVVLSGHKKAVFSVAFNSLGTHLVTASEDCTARIWNAATGEAEQVLRGHKRSVLAAAFSADATRVVTGSEDGTARIWDCESGKQLVMFGGHEGAVSDAAFSPDGTRIAAASAGGCLRVWDAASGRAIAVLRGHFAYAASASFSADGSRVVTTSGDGTAIVWNASTAEPVVTLRGHESGVHSAAFSSDGNSVATASLDGTLRVWNCGSGDQIAVLHEGTGGARGLHFTVDCKCVVFPAGDGARQWEIATGRVVTVEAAQKFGAEGVCRSVDGTRYVTLEGRNAIVWDAVSHTKIAALCGHEEPVRSASFSSDGERLVTTCSDGTARIWDLSRAAALAGDPSEVVIASIAFGRGVMSDEERGDLLMQLAPENLYEALLGRLTPQQRESVKARSEMLARPLHPGCYLALDLWHVPESNHDPFDGVPVVHSSLSESSPTRQSSDDANCSSLADAESVPLSRARPVGFLLFVAALALAVLAGGWLLMR